MIGEFQVKVFHVVTFGRLHDELLAKALDLCLQLLHLFFILFRRRIVHAADLLAFLGLIEPVSSDNGSLKTGLVLPRGSERLDDIVVRSGSDFKRHSVFVRRHLDRNIRKS